MGTNKRIMGTKDGGMGTKEVSMGTKWFQYQTTTWEGPPVPCIQLCLIMELKIIKYT